MANVFFLPVKIDCSFCYFAFCLAVANLSRIINAWVHLVVETNLFSVILDWIYLDLPSIIGDKAKKPDVMSQDE